jgi:hypothetical protein
MILRSRTHIGSKAKTCVNVSNVMHELLRCIRRVLIRAQREAVSTHRSSSLCATTVEQWSMSQALSFLRDWLAEHKVWHIEFELDGSICMRLRGSCCNYCCNYFASAADVRTHIFADHINNQPFSITIKKESDDG